MIARSVTTRAPPPATAFANSTIQYVAEDGEQRTDYPVHALCRHCRLRRSWGYGDRQLSPTRWRPFPRANEDDFVEGFLLLGPATGTGSQKWGVDRFVSLVSPLVQPCAPDLAPRESKLESGEGVSDDGRGERHGMDQDDRRQGRHDATGPDLRGPGAVMQHLSGKGKPGRAIGAPPKPLKEPPCRSSFLRGRGESNLLLTIGRHLH